MGGAFHHKMDRGRESQSSTTACRNIPERDRKDEGEGSPRQACSYWFARSSWLATVARTMRYYVFMALSVSHRGFCRWFCWSLSLPTGMLPLNSLFPSIYDIETVILLLMFILVFRMGFLTLWPRAGSLKSAYVRIQSINQSMKLQ